MSRVEKALDLVKALPRINLNTLKPYPGYLKKRKTRRGRHGGRKCGRGQRGQVKMSTLPYIGFEGNNTPFYLIVPKEPYYTGHHLRRQYPPMSLHTLQRLIDLGQVNPDEPIDLTTLCNTHLYRADYRHKHYGVQLTDEGADIFDAKVNIEVQWTNELTIAAVEKNGGVITSRFYDLSCVRAMANTKDFFKQGLPIPKCKLPPKDAVEYYTNAENRGYLANQDEIEEARIKLAQKYGYMLPDITKDPLYPMLSMRKAVNQIWYGLQSGWVVNMEDKLILKPKDEEYVRFYQNEC